MSGYRTVTYTSIDARLAQAWDKLWSNAANSSIFNHRRWFISIIAAYGITDFRIHACYKGRTLVGLIPLRSYRIFGIRVTGSVGNNFLYGASFLVADYSSDLFFAFFQPLFHDSNFYLTRIEEKSAQILHRLFPGIFFSVMAGVPFISCHPNPLRYRSHSRIQDFERTISKYTGRLEFKTDSHTDNISMSPKDIFDIEQSSVKKIRGKELFSNPVNRSFYENIFQNWPESIQVTYLIFDGKKIANITNFMAKKICFGIQIAYLKGFNFLSPGKLLTYHTLKNLPLETVDIYDFGAGMSDFKRQFTPEYFLEYDLYASPNIFILSWWKFINSLRRAKKVLIPEKYTLDNRYLFKHLK